MFILDGSYLMHCVADIDHWMSCSRLKLNTDKTQVIWIGTRQQLAKLSSHDIQLQSAIGVYLDDQLTMSSHVDHLCRSCFHQLRQLRYIRRSLSIDAKRTLIQAFVSSRLDYCNSLLYGISDGLMVKLQRVQNAAARLITGARKYDHISSTLRRLHWLPVRQRVIFKVAVLVYRCLHGLAPGYLARDCIPVATLAGRRHLRSAASDELYVPSSRTVRAGSRQFSVSGPTVWNALPNDLRCGELSLATFRKRLKTHLFERTLWTVCFVAFLRGSIALERRWMLLLHYITMCDASRVSSN